MDDIAYKFVAWDVPPLEALKDSFPYCMKEKLLKDERLTREEKDDLFRLLSTQDRYGIKLMGWYFDFSDYLRRIWVKLKFYGIQEYYAADKSSIRRCFGNDVVEMIYVDKEN